MGDLSAIVAGFFVLLAVLFLLLSNLKVCCFVGFEEGTGRLYIT
jgi:hypothetical protein